MKKIFLFLIIYILFIPISIKADTIYSMDIDIDIEKNGTARITEVWDVKATGGSEWYKEINDIEGSVLSDFIVYMDGEKLIYKDYWNINETITEKSGFYGINTTKDGIELCFGKGDMKRHTFTLEYTLSNYIFNTSDSQILYWTIIPKTTLNYFSVDITSYYNFPDTLDVWGYGYKGYAYVENGKIKMSNEGSVNGNYVTLLVKFPQNVFDTNFKINKFNNFNDVYKNANVGSFDYDYNKKNNFFNSRICFILTCVLIYLLLFIILIIGIIRDNRQKKYGYVGNKKIIKKNVPMFRHIPCNKDIYYANILIKLNNFGYKKLNIFGAIILKWINEGKIKFYNKEVGIFKNKKIIIDLTMKPTFDNFIEIQLFDMMYKASNDGILENKEFKKWVEKEYDYFLELLKCVEEEGINSLKADLHIYNRVIKKECKYKNVMDDKLYNDSVELYGLKKYLEQFSRINTKEVLEVKLWDEYLMFAYLFGIADKVAKQLNKINPEILKTNNFDYDIIRFVDKVSTKTYHAARNAKNRDLVRAAAESSSSRGGGYSSGGGGYSSGGGGGGSRGGGGSAGGR